MQCEAVCNNLQKKLSSEDEKVDPLAHLRNRTKRQLVLVPFHRRPVHRVRAYIDEPSFPRAAWIER